MDRVIRWSARLATVAALILGLWIACRGVRFSEVAAVLRSTPMGPLALRTLPLLAMSFVLRAGRFRTLLGETRGHFRGVVATMLLSQAANNVLPLRAGELVKTRDFTLAGHPLRRVVVAQAVEKLIEGGSLVILCAPAMAICFGYRSRLFFPLALAAVVGLALVAAAVNRFDLQPSRVGRSLVWAFAADAIELALIAVTLDALGLGSSFCASFAILGAVNLAIALPSAPGNAGAIEAGGALALVALGATRPNAVAFALLYRVVQWVPVTLAGALVWAWRARARVAARRIGMPPAPLELSASLRRREPRS
jgi:uncharacterized membrane protein YbhN (UPF0104 family)